MGQFDYYRKGYVEDRNDIVYKIVIEENKKYDRNSYNKMDVKELMVEYVEDDNMFGDEEEIIEDGEDEQEQGEYEDDIVGSLYGGEGNIYIATIVCVTIGVIACLLIMYCVYKCVTNRRTGDASMMSRNMYSGEMQSLLRHKRRGY
eukprot:232531_1